MTKASMRIITVLLTLPVLLAASSADLQSIIVESQGSGNNERSALQVAKANAARKAADSLVLCKAEQDRLEARRDDITRSSLAAMRQYDITARDTLPNGQLQVQITASFNEKAMHLSLLDNKVLLATMQKPTALVMFTGKDLDTTTLQALEDSVRSFLEIRCGFTLTPPATAASIRNSQQKLTRLRNDPSSAAEIGSDYKAQLLLDGRAGCIVLDDTTGARDELQSVRAEVALRVINCSTGQLVHEVMARATRSHLSPDAAGLEALAAAGREAIRQTLDPIILDWKGVLEAGIPLSLEIQGVQSVREKNAIVHTLRSMSGVTEVQTGPWNGSGKILTVVLHFRGSASEFSSRVDGYKMSRRGGSLAVTGVSGRDIRLAVQAK